MSVGISIYYKLISRSDDKVTYGYSGANISKEYDKKYLLAYDGVIEIDISALIKKSAIEALKDNNIKISNECKYEWHQPRLTDEDGSYGFFAINVISKIFREYKKDMQVAEEGAVVY